MAAEVENDDDLTMSDFAAHWWTFVGKKLKKAVVFIDDESVECLHWQTGLNFLRENKIAAVREFSTFESGSDDQKKAAFIINGPVLSLKKDILREIVINSKFEYCQVITNASGAVHRAAAGCPGVDPPQGQGGERIPFEELEEEILQWMGNANFTCQVFYVPFGIAAISKSLYLATPFMDLNPLLYCDVEKMLEKSNLTPDSPLTLESMSYDLRISVQHFVSFFDSLMQNLCLKEDIFTVGATSRLLGEQLEAFPAAKVRRKTASKSASLIIVDRNLDLFNPTWCSTENPLDKLRMALPGFPSVRNDVAVEMGSGFVTDKREDFFPPGCLASEAIDNNDYDLIMDNLIMEDEDKVVDVLKNGLNPESENLNDALAEFLEKNLKNEDVIKENLDLIQRSRAILCVKKSKRLKALNHVRDIEEKFIKSDDKKGFLVHIAKVLRSRKERGINLDDILLLIINCFSGMNPDEGFFYPEDEDRLQSALSEAVVQEKDALPPGLSDLAREFQEVDEMTAYKIVKNIFQRLNSVPKIKSASKVERNLRDTGFLEGLFRDIFSDDRKDIPDLEHRTGGLGGFIKSGIGLFGVSVNKKHPRENPNILLFVVGGISAAEAKSVRKIVEEKSQCKFSVGSTKILSPKEILLSVLKPPSL